MTTPTDRHIRRTRFWMTRRYLFALSLIALLAGSAFGIVWLLIAEYQSVIAVVNVSGRQRMLTQRSAMFVENLVHEADPARRASTRRQLQETKSVLWDSHLALSKQPGASSTISQTMSDAVADRYFSGPVALDLRMRNFIAALEQILTTPDAALSPADPAIQHVLNEATGTLLAELDAMVALYQREGEAAFSGLQMLEGGFLALTLLVLLFEVLFIFRPMVETTTGHMSRISEISDDLRRARDLLEEKVAERTRALEIAHETAVAENLAKSRYLAAASHDLQQPLEAIGMFSSMLKRRLEKEQDRALLQDMRRAEQSMRQLLDSILQLSKIEAGVVEPSPRPLRLADFLRPLALEYRHLAAQKGFGFRYVESNLWGEADPLLLERILRNLLTNALRYCRSGALLLGVRRQGERLEIQVHDTGPGIPDEALERIFQEFTQLDDPDRDRSEGIGLGLTIARRLADLMGLRLSCRSILGRGSVFSVSLPKLDQADPLKKISDKSIPPASDSPRQAL
ncbi:MAG: ATP-binding protein [Magnetospiraceae bacterium]